MATFPARGTQPWDTELLAWLNEEHNDDGTLKRPAYVAGVTPYNVTPATLANWRTALANVRTGTADARVLCIGDSTTRGRGTGSVGGAAYPTRLAEMLDAAHLPAAPGLIIPPSALSGDPAPDGRLTYGSGWSVVSYAGFATRTALVASSGATGVVTITPGVSCDRLDIYYMRSDGNGDMQISVDGGAATTVSTSGTPQSVEKTTVDLGTVASDHVITITPSVAAVGFVGAEPYLSDTKQVLVGNAGVSATRTDHWDGTIWSDGAITAYDADLTIIMLGINDSGNGHTVETYIANLTTLLTQAQTTGDVMLASFAPSSLPADTLALQAAYVAALPDLARDHGCAYIDVHARFGDYDTANGLGLMADTLHPNALGAADIAGAVFAALRLA